MVTPGALLGAWASFGTGQYERGIQAAQESIRLNATIAGPYMTMAINNLCLNRFAEAADSLRLGAERKIETPVFLVNRYYLAFLKGDQAGMEREIARASGTAVDIIRLWCSPVPDA